MLVRYLVFAADCSVCSGLAKAAQAALGNRLELISIHDPKARDLLDQAYPDGWRDAPYLLTVDRDHIRASTGIRAALHLGWLMGPRKAWQVYNLAWRANVRVPPGTFSFDSPRRRFLKLGAAVLTATGLAGAQSASVAFACVPCDSCGETCRLSTGCYRRCCERASGTGICLAYSVCTRYNCYDQRTGEYCYSASCCCVGCPSYCA